MHDIFEDGISNEWRWERIRKYRNMLLCESDFRMVEDAPWDKAKWATYRQQLRDLTNTVEDPLKIVFPSPPNA